jgi:pimeloyl-ACP methyl ester carboxylesterase
MTTVSPVREVMFDTGEVQINCVELGGEGPPLLLIHGLSSSWQSWVGVVPQLTAGWHCYAMDLRGHGASGHVKGGYHRDKYAADAAAVIRGHIGEPVHLIGHSLGATTAMGACALVPDMVKAVIYEDPPMFSHTRPGNSGRSRFGARLEQIKSAKSAEELAELASEPGFTGQAGLDRARRWLQMDINVLEATVDRSASAGWDAEGQLRKATPRALLLQADPDNGGALTGEEAARTMELLPDATLTQWPDSGHNMHAQFPERFVETVRTFFAG